MPDTGPRRGQVFLWASGAILVGSALLLLALAISGQSLGELRRAALPLVMVAILSGGLAVWGWHRDRRALAAAVGAQAAEREERERDLERARAETARTRREAQERLDDERREAQQRLAEVKTAIEQERKESENRLASERRAREMVERARRAEQQWALEMRSQVIRLHRERGALANPDDVPGLVLQTALSLLGAEKGMLLSRREAGERLTVDRHLGFDHDPQDSALARSFAERVMSRDETIRENDEAALDAASRTPADDEIDNLVAIPIFLRGEFAGVVVCANREGGFHEYEDDVLLALGDHASSVLDNARLRGELRSAYLSTIQMLGDAIAAKDPFLGGHSRQVSKYVASVAERLGVEPRRREELIFGSLLHDIGKIGISERILLKPAGLTPEERAIVELHPRIGYRLVSRIPALEPIAGGVLHHHERYDGTGYPARLKGEQIPLEARIICVADSFAAMTQDRPYRTRLTLEAACVELERCAGTQFDPEVVRVFVDVVRRAGDEDRWPDGDTGDLGRALGDTELTLHRHEGETLLGSGVVAMIDNLTLLYSHRYLHETAAAAALRAEALGDPFCVVMVALTGLAALNDDRGHAAGDAALQAAGRALQRAASRCGGTACRYSGDRLALVVPDADLESGQRCAADLLADWPADVAVASAVAQWKPGDRGSQVIARARVLLSTTAQPGGRRPDDVAAVALDGAAPRGTGQGLVEPPEFQPGARTG